MADEMLMTAVLSVVGLLLGTTIGYFLVSRTATSKVTEAEERAKGIIKEAQVEAKSFEKEKQLEIKEEWLAKKQEFEKKSNERRKKLQRQDQDLKQREESVKKKLDTVQRKEKQLQSLETSLQQQKRSSDAKAKQIDELLAEQNTRLERITGMSKEDAKKFLMENLVNEAKAESAQLVKDVRDESRLNARKEAQRVIVQAIQRSASDYSIENTVSVVNLKSEDQKGRIIGREGRNIRAFESATGVDLIIDDTPEAVIISGFDAFRRAIAKRALEKLLADGRIHPTRIEEIVEKVEAELTEEVREEGENACMELNIHNVHPEIMKYVGRMKYRSSYGQNLLNHSIEVGYLCGVMANELGLDPKLAVRSGLLHDIGKCVDRSIEGPHAILGYDLCKKYKEHPVVTNAVGSHHEDIEMETPYAALVQAADAISGARPGARRESLENYVKRLEQLEDIAHSFDGVQKTFAIQAGREIRVIVEPDRVDDLLADTLAHDIAKKVEQEMQYPGQIRVTVVREKRAIGYAK